MIHNNHPWTSICSVTTKCQQTHIVNIKLEWIIVRNILAAAAKTMYKQLSIKRYHIMQLKLYDMLNTTKVKMNTYLISIIVVVAFLWQTLLVVFAKMDKYCCQTMKMHASIDCKANNNNWTVRKCRYYHYHKFMKQ